MFDEGIGPPIVVIPGVQGRWEWMRPALRGAGGALPRDQLFAAATRRRRFDRRSDSRRYDGRARRGAARPRAAICGVSFGGLVARAYAAARPERTAALVLVSPPAPGWTPSPGRRGTWRARGCPRRRFSPRRRGGCGRRSPRRSTAGRRGCGSASSTWRGSPPRRSSRRRWRRAMRLRPGAELARRLRARPRADARRHRRAGARSRRAGRTRRGSSST